MQRALAMRAVLGLVLSTVTLAVVACNDGEPSPPTFSNEVAICQRPRAIDTEFDQGEALADKTLALTFDDGPAEITSELSAYLRSEGIAATFFVNGANVEGFEDVLPQVAADGHLIGNHTQTHAALTTLSAAEVIAEVEQTDAVIAPFVPGGKLYFRPPFGDWNESVQKAVAGSAMNKYAGPVGWDIGDRLSADSAADWDCWDAENGTRTVPECGALYSKEIRAKRKGIVLLHDGPPGGDGAKTLAMIKALVPSLKSEGYRFVRVDSVPLGKSATSSGASTGSAGGSGSSADPCLKP